MVRLASRRIVRRIRKSPFVRLFDKTPQGVICPHFYELILSNGCPFRCSYCYLKLTFRGRKDPVLFVNPWRRVREEIEAVPQGVFSTGELADSLAIIPPLLPRALDYFSTQETRTLLLVTKSANVGILLGRQASPSVIVSFSVNNERVHQLYEHATPPPSVRLEAARVLKSKGWRVRIRIDPIILENGCEDYRELCHRVAELEPEMVTVGTLRQYPGLHNFSPDAPRDGLKRAPDGRLRYPATIRIETYQRIAEWLGFQPALCKETADVWRSLGWSFSGCNCTEGWGCGREQLTQGHMGARATH